MGREPDRKSKKLIVGITGATGAAYGIEILKILKALPGWESHLVLTDAGALNVWHELKLKRKEVERLATAAYHPRDIGAAIASGSFLTDGMVIAAALVKVSFTCEVRGCGDKREDSEGNCEFFK